jgi:tyrosine aminotransferase
MMINPSNPCGSVYSKAHLTEIADFARKHGLTVLTDEIYHGLAYGEGTEFFPFAEVAPDIPVIKAGGISKIYGVPGWRLGWIIVYNRHGFLTDVKEGMLRATTIWLSPCSLIQAALPKILKEVGEDFHDAYKANLKKSSALVTELCSQIEGLNPIKGQGSMYMMV